MPSHRAARAVVRPSVLIAGSLVLALLGGVPAHADASADDVAASVNAERAAAGRGALVRDPSLDAAATEWAAHLAATGTIAHSTNSWRQARARAGFTLCCAENVAAGHQSPSVAMTAWMGSNGHRASILNAGYSHLGVGHVYVAGSQYGHYWVQVFAAYPFNRAAHEAYVRALYRDFLGRSAGASEVQAWTDRLAGGAGRGTVAAEVSRSAEWITSVITRFYRDTLGREPDPAGLAHWVQVAREGRPVAQIAADFYASDEYFQRIGGNGNETWVRDLYRTLLGRPADGAGLRGWLAVLASGAPRSQVAMGFYQSAESSRLRVTSLYRTLLGRAPDPSGLTTWPPVVREQGDLALAAHLASSDEYFDRAQPR